MSLIVAITIFEQNNRDYPFNHYRAALLQIGQIGSSNTILFSFFSSRRVLSWWPVICEGIIWHFHSPLVTWPKICYLWDPLNSGARTDHKPLQRWSLTIKTAFSLKNVRVKKNSCAKSPRQKLGLHKMKETLQNQESLTSRHKRRLLFYFVHHWFII